MQTTSRKVADRMKPIRMPIHGPLEAATFIQRPNRFLAQVEVRGKKVWAHVPDPGRLNELLLPRASVYVQKHPRGTRKTRYSMVMVQHGETLISINSQLPNRFARFCFDHQLLSQWIGWEVVRPEITLGESRFDFMLKRGRHEKIVEVKSVTLVEDGIARFPDAVTSRGARHVRHLADLIEGRRSCAILFLIQRPDAVSFEPHWGRDPVFAEALLKAHRAGVEVLVTTAHLSTQWMWLGKTITANLEPD